MQEGPKTTQRAGNPTRRAAGKQIQPTAPETIAKKGGIPVGMILMAILGILFLSYLTNAGNLQSGADAFFSAQVHSAHRHDDQVAVWFMRLLPFVILAFVTAILYVMLASFGVGKPKPRPRPLTQQLTVHEFAEIAAQSAVGARVAREMYRILLPEYAPRMRATLPSTFLELDVPSDTVYAMFEELVRKSGGSIHGSVGIEALGTPLEMMQAAEQCLDRAALERRAALKRTAIFAEEISRTIAPVPAGHRR